MIFHDLALIPLGSCVSPEDLDLEEGSWDVHVITGALKLFFRELQEPLFPYNLFNDFICGISKIIET